MNGCFGTDYSEGDPCYEMARKTDECTNMLEGAAYVGVGYDGTGDYTYVYRKKSLVQRARPLLTVV